MPVLQDGMLPWTVENLSDQTIVDLGHGGRLVFTAVSNETRPGLNIHAFIPTSRAAAVLPRLQPLGSASGSATSRGEWTAQERGLHYTQFVNDSTLEGLEHTDYAALEGLEHTDYAALEGLVSSLRLRIKMLISNAETLARQT